MGIMLPLIGMFVFIGLTQTTMSRRAYVYAFAVILVVLLYFFFKSPY